MEATDGAMTPAPVLARTVFLRWERLRVLYNASLAVVVLGFIIRSGGVHEFMDTGFLLFLVSRCFLANVCFMLGPGVEAYAAWLGWRPPWLRSLLFTLGLMLSVGLALLSVALFEMSRLD